MNYNFIGHQENFNEDVDILMKILNDKNVNANNESYGPKNKYPEDTTTKDWFKDVPCETMSFVLN